MIRKGIRPRVRPALDLPGDGRAFRRVLPFRRHWPAIAVIAVFDAVFLFPAITTFRQAAAEWARFDSLFDLVGALFLSAWLLGWSLAPLALTTILLLLLFGRESVTAGNGTLRVFLGLPLIGVATTYRVAAMRNLRFEQPAGKSGRAWRGGHLAFDYGANTFVLGSRLTGAEVSALKGWIETASGVRPRRGDATPGELEGAWPADSLETLSGADPAPPPAPVAARSPVSLSSPSTLALVAANLVPLAGAAFLGWRLSDVMVLYWAESAIIGFFNVCKIAVVQRWMALLAGPFFIGHFGAFMSVHFLFLWSLFVKGPQDTGAGDLAEVAQLFATLWPALAILFASHALSFFLNFIGRREYVGRTASTQMAEPYTRIVFMHLVLIFGGGLTLVLGETAPVLLLVIAVKIWVDVRAHLKQRGKAAPA
jgi:hypothetical protein